MPSCQLLNEGFDDKGYGGVSKMGGGKIERDRGGPLPITLFERAHTRHVRDLDEPIPSRSRGHRHCHVESTRVASGIGSQQRTHFFIFHIPVFQRVDSDVQAAGIIRGKSTVTGFGVHRVNGTVPLVAEIISLQEDPKAIGVFERLIAVIIMSSLAFDELNRLMVGKSGVFTKPFSSNTCRKDWNSYREKCVDGGCSEVQAEKKRRLSVEQVKWLEMSFERERKLDPHRRDQLALEVGLKPRQVAVWYQNRRARWKAKKLERDFDHLKQKYDSVFSDKRKLKTEIMSLNEELQAKRRQVIEEDQVTSDCNYECITTLKRKGEDENCEKKSSSYSCSDAPAAVSGEQLPYCSDCNQIVKCETSLTVQENQLATAVITRTENSNSVDEEQIEINRTSNQQQCNIGIEFEGRDSIIHDHVNPSEELYSYLMTLDDQQAATHFCFDWLNL
eukprot:Gb_35959 [translate_table: standard]